MFVQTAVPKHYNMKPHNTTELLPNQTLSKKETAFQSALNMLILNTVYNCKDQRHQCSFTVGVLKVWYKDRWWYLGLFNVLKYWFSKYFCVTIFPAIIHIFVLSLDSDLNLDLALCQISSEVVLENQCFRYIILYILDKVHISSHQIFTWGICVKRPIPHVPISHNRIARRNMW